MMKWDVPDFDEGMRTRMASQVGRSVVVALSRLKMTMTRNYDDGAALGDESQTRMKEREGEW